MVDLLTGTRVRDITVIIKILSVKTLTSDVGLVDHTARTPTLAIIICKRAERVGISH